MLVWVITFWILVQSVGGVQTIKVFMASTIEKYCHLIYLTREWGGEHQMQKQELIIIN